MKRKSDGSGLWSSNLIQMGSASLCPTSDPNLPNRTNWVSAGGENDAVRRFPLAPDPERTDTSGDGVARQCGLVCDALNDEQRSDDLSDPP